MTLRTATLLAALGLTACTSGLQDPLHPTGSSTLAATGARDAVVVANVDQGSVTLLSDEGEILQELLVGSEPTRVAPLGDDRFLVTLRGAREVVVLRLDGATLSIEQRLATGTEPYGVVSAEDGSRFWVAASTEDLVQEFDGQTYEQRRTFAVPGEPRWLALNPAREALYAGSAFGGQVHFIDLDTGEVVGVSPQTIEGNLGGGDPVAYTPRITGDLAVSPDGRYVAVPVLYVENTTEGAPASVPGAGYYVQNEGGRFRPGLSLMPTDIEGRPKPQSGEAIDLTVLTPDRERVGSYPTSVTITPDKSTFIVSMEASDALVVVSAGRLGLTSDGIAFNSSPDEQFRLRNNVVVEADGAGPRGVVMLGDGAALVHGFLDQQISTLDVDFVAALAARGPSQSDVRATGTASVVGVAAPSTASLARVTAESLPPEVAAGRRAFYAARDSRMSDAVSGVSCSTCHSEGRNDGLNWPFPEPLGARQTPSLAGVVSMTAPVTWDSNVATVADEVMTTGQSRMGGSVSMSLAEDVAAFVDWTREVDHPSRDAETDAILRGKQLFGSAEVGCAECHDGAALTDNETYAMYGLDDVRTRSLVGVARTAPYLHDGSAPTLRDVLLSARGGQMGDTGGLSDSQLDDLEAYLTSL